MASSASIFKQKLKEGAGLSSKTSDGDVAMALSRLGQLERDVALLKRVVQTANEAVMINSGRARQQMLEVVMGMGERLVMGASTEHYAKFKSVHDYMDTVLPAKLTELFDKAVVAPLDEWITLLSDLKKRANLLEEFRIKYDHYKEKFVQLQEEKRQVQMKGKVFSKESEERLARNEEKLREAETGYIQARDTFLATALVAFEESGHRMDHVLLRLMQYEKQVYADCASCTKAFEPSCTSLLASGKDWKTVQAGGDRMPHFVRIVRQAREDSKKLDLLDAPIATVPGGMPSGSYSAGAKVSPGVAAHAPQAAGPRAGGGHASGGWDSGFGAEAEAVPDYAHAAPKAAAKPSGVSPGNPFGGPSAGAAPAGGSGQGGDAVGFGASKPPKAPAASAPPPETQTSGGDAKKPSPAAGGGGLFSKAKGLFGGGNPFGSSSSASSAAAGAAAGASVGGKLQDNDDEAGDPEPSVQPSGRAGSHHGSSAGGGCGDGAVDDRPLAAPAPASKASAAAAGGGWDEFPAPTKAAAPKAPQATGGGFEADPWSAPTPAPAPAPAARSRGGSAVAAGGGFDSGFGADAWGAGAGAVAAPAARSSGAATAPGFDDPWGPPAPAPAPRPLAAPAGGAAPARRQAITGAAAGNPFPASFDSFGSAAPAPAPAAGGGFGSFDSFDAAGASAGSSSPWGAPAPAAKSRGADPFDPFGGM